MTNFTPYYLLHSDNVLYVRRNRWNPFLCFDYIITTHKYHFTNYKKPLSKNRIRLYKEIIKLHNKDWVYTKFHLHLRKNDFKIGKSRTVLDSMIKKRIKKEQILN